MKKGTKKLAKGVTVEALIAQGNAALSNMQPELAVKFFERANGMSPMDTNVMDALADVHLQLGDQARALELLLTSTSLAPEANPFKWLYLAQLQEGLDSLSTYMRGIAILERMMKDTTDDTDSSMLKKHLAKAHCSVSELYLTDLCYEDDAETKCEEAINRAIAADAETLDGQQALTSLRLSQCRTAEAGLIIQKVFHRLKAIRDKVSARTVIEEMTCIEESDECKDAPEFEFCMVTAKFLIECAAADPLLAEHAMTLITDLLHDDDENVELWYMMGVASLSVSPPDTDSARYHLEVARDMMDKLLGDDSPEDFEYSEHYGLVREHLRLIAAQEEEKGDISGGTAVVDGAANSGRGDPPSLLVEDDEEWSEGEEDEEKVIGMAVEESS